MANIVIHAKQTSIPFSLSKFKVIQASRSHLTLGQCSVVVVSTRTLAPPRGSGSTVFYFCTVKINRTHTAIGFELQTDTEKEAKKTTDVVTC